MTGEQRAILDEIADPQGLSPLLSRQRAALAAALADLDACRKALRPIADRVANWREGTMTMQLLNRTVYLAECEADAVLAAAAAGEERS